MNLPTVDAISWLSRNRARFFPEGRIDAMRLLAFLMCDVLELGHGACRIAGHDGWWFVVSDVDWLSHDELSVRDLFARVVPAPQHGEHSLRAEVLLTAYAEDVFTASGDEEIEIKGTRPSEDLVELAVRGGPSRRLIAFRLPGADG